MKKMYPTTGGFGLMELLAAVALVLIVCLLLMRLLSVTQDMTERTRADSEVFNKLRSVFDRIAADYASAVPRADMPYFFQSATGNDSFFFHSAVPGNGGIRQVSRIGYRIGPEGIERGAMGFDWSNSGASSLKFHHDLFTDSFVTDPNHPDYDTLARGVFRLETGFLLDDGTYINSPSTSQWSSVRAVVVTLAAISQRGLSRSNGNLAELADLFPDAPNNSKRPLEVWSELLNDETFISGNSQFPAASRKEIRIRERVITLR